MLSFTTRVVSGATEIVDRDGGWSFATQHEVEMLKRIAELEAALLRIASVRPEGLHKSAADAFFECQSIADAALNPRQQ